MDTAWVPPGSTWLSTAPTSAAWMSTSNLTLLTGLLVLQMHLGLGRHATTVADEAPLHADGLLAGLDGVVHQGDHEDEGEEFEHSEDLSLAHKEMMMLPFSGPYLSMRSRIEGGKCVVIR